MSSSLKAASSAVYMGLLIIEYKLFVSLCMCVYICVCVCVLLAASLQVS